MTDHMVTVVCPACGRRLLSTRIYKTIPRTYTITDDENPRNMDTKLKCPRCKSIVGIEK